MKKLILLMITVLCLSCQLRSDKKSMVVGQIQKASDLATLEVTVSKILTSQKERKFFIKLQDAIFVAETEAKIKYGIKFDRIKPDKISIKGGQVTITLPPVEMLSFSYPFEDINIIKYDDYFYQGYHINEIEDLYRQGELKIKEQIKKVNVTKECEIKTRIFLTKFLNNLGFHEVHINFENE